MWIAFLVLVVVFGVMLADADSETARFLIGVAAGGLAGLVYRLRSQLRAHAQKIQTLEQRLNGLERARDAQAEKAPSPHAPPSPREPTQPEPLATMPKSPSAAKAAGVSTQAFKPEPRLRPAAAREKPSYVDLALRWVRRWLTTGNVPVKVGVLISFFGVSFLLKYAAEQNYLTLPIELRLMGVGVAALGALYFGWHQRARRPAFALSLQGGAIGVLFLTVFAAFQLYHLLSALVAFGLLVLLTVAAGVLAVLQNAMALAVLGVVGGFLAPVLISTGSGSHVALFSYYAVLNGAVFGVAWFRPWRVLNLIGFVFTFVIGTAWGYQFYQPEYFASVEPFLVLFFLMYLGISMAYALGQSIRLRSYVDSSLVFGLPLVAFPLQKQLVEHFEYGTAISAVVLAMVYMAAAMALLRSRLRARVRLLGEAFLVLGVGFATLAVPLALSAHWTALTWALEGAAMVWLGTRQNRQLPTAAGAALQLLAGVAFLYSLVDTGRTGDGLFLNDGVLGGVVLALAGLTSARWLESRGNWFKNSASSVAWLLFGWGLVWWFATLSHDLVRVASDAWLPSSWLLLLAGTGAALRLAQRRLHWHKIRVVLSGYLPAMLFTAIVWLDVGYGAHYLPFGGWLAWPLALMSLAFIFHGKEGLLETTRPWQRAMTVWLLALLLSREAHWAMGSGLLGNIGAEGIWASAAVLAVAVALHAVIWQLWRGERLAVHHHSRDWSLRGIGPVLVLALTASLALLLTSSGDPAPLFYLPLLNPLSLATTAVVLTAVHWLRVNKLLEVVWLNMSARQWLWIGLAGFTFVLITGEVTRTIHHWTGVPFRAEALFESVRVQATLSVVWALAALTVMVSGHRRARRRIYLCGAALMAVVVAKLFLVDLAQSDTLERIVSFIGVGLLLLAVGFLAPVPPKQPEVGRG